MQERGRPQDRRGSREREEAPTLRDWTRFKDFYTSLFYGNDVADMDELLDFLMMMHVRHRISISGLDKLYQFFFNFSEKLTRLKANKVAKRSFRHLRRKMLLEVPTVLTDILRVFSDGEEEEDQDLEKVFRDRHTVRQVSKVKLQKLTEHVYQHPKHRVDKDNPPVRQQIYNNNKSINC